MAADAAVVLHRVQPVALRDILADTRMFAVEIARGRDVKHRVPVDRRIILRRGGSVWRDRRGQVELLSRLAGDFRAIHESVAAHPQRVIGFR